MIILGWSASWGLTAVLSEVATALGESDATDPEDLWVLGAPRASDWSTIVSWTGRVHALHVTEGAYREALAARARTSLCFTPDRAYLPKGLIHGSVDLPRADPVGQPPPPAPETALGSRRQRRLDDGRLPETTGVAWVEGIGAAALADASLAWARSLAVVLLVEEGATPLGAGAAILARSALEVDEATSFLSDSPAIARALALAGGRFRALMPRPEQVAQSLIDAARLGTPAASG